MLPSPAQVWDALVTDFPTLMANAAVTLQEAAYGLAIGIAVALALATLMHLSLCGAGGKYRRK